LQLIHGIASALSPENLLYAFVGCFLGTLVGVLPGLGPVSAVAILFPFTTYLPPAGMVISLASIYYGAMYGGSTTSILMNVPGETASVVTALDGFAMTKRGRAGPALAIAAIVSFMAGIVGSVLISILGPSIARVALDFGPAEYLGLGLFSLTAVAGLAGKSLVKGMIATLLGMLLGTVGLDAASSIPRLTFGSVSLLQGLVIAPITIGLFGLGEVLRTVQEKSDLAATQKLGNLMPNKQEFKAGLAAGARGTAIAFPLGLFPGMTPAVTSFLAYSIERHLSKEPEKFGTGMIEGVAAPEAANNAAAMANLVPLLSLGIPTGATTALILAALTMYGLIPGPLLFTQYASFTWTVIGSFFVANCILLVLNLPLVGLWARITMIPRPIVTTTIMAVCVVGSYSLRTNVFDVWITGAFGLLGWAMSRTGWPPAPVVLGFILGPIIEMNARRVLAISPGLLLARPVFWMFMLMGAIAIWLSHRLSAVTEE
jgi:putative tricarboxylic transport membrane protein